MSHFIWVDYENDRYLLYLYLEKFSTLNFGVGRLHNLEASKFSTGFFCLKVV